MVHCAAWTAVDDAEDEDKQAIVRAINAGGTENIANDVQRTELQDGIYQYGLCV